MDARARDFRLVAAAPWTTAGTDGRALGADIVKLPLALAPVVTLPSEPEPPRAPDVVPFSASPTRR
jgi:hypothetical protein